MAMDLVLPRGGAAGYPATSSFPGAPSAAGDADESLGDFVRRRLGREALSASPSPSWPASTPATRS